MVDSEKIPFVLLSVWCLYEEHLIIHTFGEFVVERSE